MRQRVILVALSNSRHKSDNIISMSEKTTAVLGIVVGVLLIAVGIDLLRTPKTTTEEASE